MLIFNMYGGLGNQMFQYAFACSVKDYTRLPIFFATDFYNVSKSHNGFELQSVFNIPENIISSKEITSQLGVVFSQPKIRRLLAINNLKYLRPKNFIYEEQYQANLSIYKLIHDRAYIHGYWQSYKYFTNIEHTIRKKFEFKNSIDGYAAHLMSLIKSTQSVSVHIRRGDYLTNKKAALVHGHCEIQYYHQAINLIANSYPGATFFVFSDDPNWASENIKTIRKDIYIVSGNTQEKSFIDMLLMSSCNHNIISNSTFSWWAAWLNKNLKKTVIAPKRWFLSNRFNAIDLIPNDWVRL